MTRSMEDPIVAESIENMLYLLRERGPMVAGDLGRALGMGAHDVGQRMKKATQRGAACIVRHWGMNGEALYALPGQPIPPRPARGQCTEEDRQRQAEIAADHAAWFASLLSTTERQRVISTMRARV